MYYVWAKFHWNRRVTCRKFPSSVDSTNDININCQQNQLIFKTNQYVQNAIYKRWPSKLKNMEFTLIHEIGTCGNSKQNCFWTDRWLFFKAITFLVFASFSDSLSSDYEYSFLQNIMKRKTVFTNSERIKHFSYEKGEILSFSAIYLICCHLFGDSVQQDAMEILCVQPQVCVDYLNRNCRTRLATYKTELNMASL